MVRALAAVVLWLLTTVLVAVAVPVNWAQHRLVDADGFAVLSEQAAHDPALQAAVANELATRMVWLIREHGFPIELSQVRDIAATYTAGPAFPSRFAQAMQVPHNGMLTGDDTGEWMINLAPMLTDSAFQPTLTHHDVQEPAVLTSPLAIDVPAPQQTGQLRELAGWVRWVGLGAGVLAAVCAVLTLVAARGRGKALTALGVSGLLAGAFGWAGTEVGQRYLNDALNQAFDNADATVHQIAHAMVHTGVDSLHHWLNLTLAGGGAVVVIGVIGALLGGLRKS